MTAAAAIGSSARSCPSTARATRSIFVRSSWSTATAVELTDPHVSKDFRERLRKSTCARFHTVLGPGSDGYHENHVHVDLAERRGGYRMCQWDVREPGEEVAAAVPLPLPRPASASHAEKNDQR